jgi:hypothetical protein
MRIRWPITALLQAESRFIRISGSDSIGKLTAALDRLTRNAQRKTA